MTPDEVEQLFLNDTRPPGSAGEDKDNALIQEDEDFRRTESLSQVLATVKNLWETGSKDLEVIAEKIGNGVRDASWRIPLGESQLLDFFIGIIEEGELRGSLVAHTLRIIGNSCADTDQNRQRVVAAECLPKIVKLLRDDSILPIVIAVLFNSCVDYEPAQVAVYKAGLNPELVSLISGPRLSHAKSSMSLIYKLLQMVASQDLTAGQESPADLEDFLEQSAIALTYLAHEQFQESFLAKPNAVPLFLQRFERTCSEFGSSSSSPLQQKSDGEELAELKQVLTIFMRVLADLSAHPAFAGACLLDGPEVRTLRRWLTPSPSSSPLLHVYLRSAACLALGNAARSDATCVSLVAPPSEVHRPLIAILSTADGDGDNASGAQLLHSALGFLKNLAIPGANKATLGDAGLLDAAVLPRLWRVAAQPQVQFAAVSLARLLLAGCPENARRVCATLRGSGSGSGAEEPSGAAAIATTTATDTAIARDDARTHLQALLRVFKETDQEPTRTEAARAVLAICRLLHTDTSSSSSILPPPATPTVGGSEGSGPGPGELQLQEFYDGHAEIPGALLFLGSQKKYPLLRSELWFVLALMARSAAGAKVVAQLMQHREMYEALSEAATGKKNIIEGGEEVDADPRADDIADSGDGGVSELALEPRQVDPKQAASMVKVNRENCLVLLHELVRKKIDDASPLPFDALRILKEGGELVLSSKDKA